MDPDLVEKIVHEVKSQGVFDEFRRNSIADVDTKPAYQNLRQRVENTVKKFLAGQRWSPDMNKIQLRERLRKHITNSGFLDVGVERIVDQVVNPKIGTVFQPKIEDIGYKYLGIPKPMKMEAFTFMHQIPGFAVNGNSLQIETSQLLPNDLEQISPDSDKATLTTSDCSERLVTNVDGRVDDDEESPPFEPLENSMQSTKEENCLAADTEGEQNEQRRSDIQSEVDLPKITSCAKTKTDSYFETQEDISSVSQKTEEQDSNKYITQNVDVYHEFGSQLSQVSSNSCLSMDGHKNRFNSNSNDNAVNISEEAQMPRFCDNSNEETNDNNEYEKKNELHFDIKQDEIKFEGTKRQSNLQTADTGSQHSDSSMREEPLPKLGAVDSSMTDCANSHQSTDQNFKFTNLCTEVQSSREASINESLNDDSSTEQQLCLADKSDNTQLSAEEEPLSNDRRTSIALTSMDCKLTDNLSQSGSQHTTQNSLSSSRHKKLTTAKQMSHKERRRDREREQRKSHKSTNSKHRIHTDKETSKHGCSSSTQSKSASQRDVTKSNRKPNSESKPQQLEMQTKVDKEKKSNANANDDHFASKNQIYWRKSTDSNDDDKAPDNAAMAKSFSEKSETNANDMKGIQNKKASIANTNTIKSKQSANWSNDDHNHSKIVILNEVLENPCTDFVDLGMASHEKSIQVMHIEGKPKVEYLHSNRSNEEEEEEELHFFDENANQFRQRLNFIDNAIDRCRQVVNSLRFDSMSPSMLVDSFATLNEEEDEESNETSHSDIAHNSIIKRPFNCITKAELRINCRQYSETKAMQDDLENSSDNKRLKLMRLSMDDLSRSPSEASLNSKENQFISADMMTDRHKSNLKA